MLFFKDFRNIKKTCVKDISAKSINISDINFEFKQDCWVDILETVMSLNEITEITAGSDTDSTDSTDSDESSEEESDLKLKKTQKNELNNIMKQKLVLSNKNTIN